MISENNFPTGTGIASSAAAFAALSLAASRAAGLALDERALLPPWRGRFRFRLPLGSGRLCGMAGRRKR